MKVIFQAKNVPDSLVPSSDVSDVSGIVSGIGIARTLRSSENQNDVSDGSSGGVERKRKPSDPPDSDFVALPIPIATPFFNFPLERKAPYASDFDSVSDYVASGNQPF